MKDIIVKLRQQITELETPGTKCKKRRDHLEKLMGECTAELRALNWHLDQQITERKRVEEALRESEEFGSSLLARSPIPMIVINPDTSVRYVNSALEKLTGLSSAEVTGRKAPYPWWTEETLQKTSGDLAEAMRQGAVRVEELFQKKNGERFWVEITSTPVRKDGELKYYLANWVDITERKRAEEEIRENERKYKLLFEGTLDGVFVLDAETMKVVLANQAAADIYGLNSVEEAVGGDLLDFVPSEERERVLRIIAKDMFENDLRQVNEFRTITKDGREIWIRAVGARTEYQGKLAGLVSFSDITERKRAEEKLRESEEELRKIFESVNDGISVIDLNGVITGVNQRTVEMHGFSSRDEVVGKSALELIAPRDHERVKTNMRKALKLGTIKVVEYTLLRTDGSEFPGELSTSVLRDAAGNWIGHITISRDITERRQAEMREKQLREELYRSSRLASVGELAAGVAHEMNNPLTGILGFSQRLLRKSADDNTKESLELIHNEAERAAKVVKNLLTFARRREPKKEYSGINDILKTTLDLRAYELKTGNIEVILDLAANLPQIMVDFYQIQEVFLNIILNAEQAMIEAHGGGKLTIKSEEIEDYIRISFTDDGPGIPAENLDRLFDPFFTTRGERGGTGLGLSLCHGIVAEHGGRIYARSKAGKGATVFVQLPLTRQLSLTTEKIGESKVAEEKLA
jgi:two-component system NtrC family sensor kinase